MNDRTKDEASAAKRTTVERRSDRELVVTRWFDAPARLVFEAWTQPELFRQWWVPKSIGLTLLSLDQDVRVGDQISLREGAKKFKFVGAAIAGAVLPAIRALDDERARFYGDVVLNSVNEAARRALEAMMKGYQYQSEFAKKYYGEGRNEGRAEEAARAVLAVLRVRGITVSDSVRDRIQAEKDPAQLERWLEKAVVAASVAEVIGDPSQAA